MNKRRRRFILLE